METCWREWRIFWSVTDNHPVLYSTYRRFRWDSDMATSDELPNDIADGEVPHGIHAMKSTSVSTFLSKPGIQGPKLFVQGAVDSYGYIKHHTDGVLRSEHARVLGLRVMDIPFQMPPCDHQERLCAVNRPLEDGVVVIERCTCYVKIDWYNPRGDPSIEAYPVDDYQPPEVIRWFTREELESLLCEWYSVPILPLGVGPWEPPWGSGPEMEPVGLI